MSDMSETIDYKIILVDSSNANFTSSTSNYSFYVNLTEPLRDVYKIKIIYSALSIPAATLGDPTQITNLDSVFIDLNNYNRLTTVLTKSQGITTNISYFDSIVLDTNNINTTNKGMTTIYNDFNSSENIYVINPSISQLTRLNFNLYDKNNNIITTSLISRFVMKICVYYSNCKTSRA
uniref:Uncharacterized protein n=1 Tax=viral metagenome TaxID=1070528 RepID=A0A6C0CH68_9ZZZZ